MNTPPAGTKLAPPGCRLGSWVNRPGLGKLSVRNRLLCRSILSGNHPRRRPGQLPAFPIQHGRSWYARGPYVKRRGGSAPATEERAASFFCPRSATRVTRYDRNRREVLTGLSTLSRSSLSRSLRLFRRDPRNNRQLRSIVREPASRNHGRIRRPPTTASPHR